MNKLKNLISFLILIFLVNCSFDDKTGIWSAGKEEKIRISELEKSQNQKISKNKIYSSEIIYSQEKSLVKKINLKKPKKNLSWEMSGLNHQNLLGNIYLSSIDNIFLKKKIGKNKMSLTKIMTQPLISENNILLSDDRGTIFSINQSGNLNWKQNIYKKIYKKIYKNLTFSTYKKNIYIADNIGFIYSIDLDTGKPLWIRNHGIPLKSKIKIYDEKIFLINQDNRILCLNIKDGSKIWDIRTVSSFIKSQNLLSLAFSNDGYLIASNSAGDLLKVNSLNGDVVWSLSTLESTLEHATDFFKSSDVVINNKNIIFSTQSLIFSYNLNNGYINWQQNVSSAATPIIDGKNIFLVTKNGYFIIINLGTGEIISSTYILKILKRKKQTTTIMGFIMGSGKIYSVTFNGHLIVSSASSGKVESFKKIGGLITSAPIINNGKLYIYTKDSRIIGFN